MTEREKQLTEALQALRDIVAGFHAVKQIRAWAAEENVASKRAALDLIDKALAAPQLCEICEERLASPGFRSCTDCGAQVLDDIIAGEH